MNIVFYSTTASIFDSDAFSLATYPSRAAVWASLSRRYPEHHFYVVTQPPAAFLLDAPAMHACLAAGRDGVLLSERVRAFVFPEDTALASLTEHICSLSPDIAIASSFWVPPYDWLGVQDSLVADALREKNVRVLCHPTALSLDSFDKNRTHTLLESYGFPMPKSVYVHHELYWCERQHHELVRNVYKECVLEQIKRMRYPVVIKDTVGLSSYSMEVAVSYKQTLSYLNSGRTKVDRIVEEYVAGMQAGVELYVRPNGECTILPPLFFSLNRYGITSPKQSIKLGGGSSAGDERYHLSELRALLASLSRKIPFSGVVQCDIVHRDEPASDGSHWCFIELNPRLSGMTETYAAALGLPLPDMLLKTALNEPLPAQAMQAVCNIKLPILTEEQFSALAAEKTVAYMHQIHNKKAKQEREKGYCELVLCAPDTKMLIAQLDDFSVRYADCMEAAFIEKARALHAQVND